MATLDLTGGHLDVRVNPGDRESFIINMPSDLTGYVWTTTGGLLLTVSPTEVLVVIPATVTATVGTLKSAQPTYSIQVALSGDEPTTLLSGRLLL